MFRTLTARAIIPVTIAVTGFVVICFILLYSVMKADLVNDAIISSTNLAGTIVRSTRFAMLRDDRETVANIIANVSQQKGLEHVRIFNKKGKVIFSGDGREIGHQVDMKTEGCLGCHEGDVPRATLGTMRQARKFTDQKGTEVLAITAPIYNEPECSTADCHVHPPGQKVLGTLDIGLSVPILMKNLPVMRGRMIVASLLVLILTIGGVAALLWRNVFLPVRLLANYVENVSRGGDPSPLPPCGPELDRIARGIREIAANRGRSRQHEDRPENGAP